MRNSKSRAKCAVFALAYFAVFVGNTFATQERTLVNYDRRIKLVGDNDAVIEVKYFDIRNVKDSTLVANVCKVSSKDSMITPGVLFVHLTEWKADHGKEILNSISFYDPANKNALVSTVNDSTSTSFQGNFLSNKDWVDKYYGALLPNGYDSLYAVIQTTTDGLFGTSATKYKTTYILFPREKFSQNDIPAYRRFFNSILNFL